jgi:hypothetical protein
LRQAFKAALLYKFGRQLAILASRTCVGRGVLHLNQPASIQATIWFKTDQPNANDLNDRMRQKPNTKGSNRSAQT